MRDFIIFIGKPREVVWQGAQVQTGIFKEPVEAIHIRKFFVEADNISDPEVHGGEWKAVYGYASEHLNSGAVNFPR